VSMGAVWVHPRDSSNLRMNCASVPEARVITKLGEWERLARVPHGSRMVILEPRIVNGPVEPLPLSDLAECLGCGAGGRL